MSVHRYTFISSIAALLVVISGCLKPPDYPVEPVLTFEGISRDSMVQGSGLNDSLLLFLSFTDGDGDIAGDPLDQGKNVFLINTKTDETVATLKFDPIIEAGANNGISGELRMVVFTTCCDYPEFVPEFPCTPSTSYPVDTLLLEAYMVDAAGNESNRVEVSPIILICDRF